MNNKRNQKLDFYKLAVAQADIEAAKIGFEQIVNNNLKSEDPLFRTLIFGSIISYAKPFIGNKQYGKLPKKWEKFKERRLRAAHKELIEIRHKIVAHNDWQDVNLVMIPPGSFIALGEHEIEVDEMHFAVKMPGVHESRIPDFIDACGFLGKKMLTELASLKDNLIPQDELPKEPFLLQF